MVCASILSIALAVSRRRLQNRHEQIILSSPPPASIFSNNQWEAWSAEGEQASGWLPGEWLTRKRIANS